MVKKLPQFEGGATEWFIVQQEYALIVMLGDDNENVGNVGVAKMLERGKQVAEQSANNDECPLALNNSLICLCDVPTPNLKANAYYKLANFDSYL